MNKFAEHVKKEMLKSAKVSKKAEYGEYQGNHLLEYIGNLLSEGYASGADPVWDINITINNDSELFDELSYAAQDYIRNEISYPVKDGHLDYSDVEIWLSGDRAKEDFTEKDLMKIFTDEETVKTLLSDPNAGERFYVSYDLEVDEDELENNEL